MARRGLTDPCFDPELKCPCGIYKMESTRDNCVCSLCLNLCFRHEHLSILKTEKDQSACFISKKATTTKCLTSQCLGNIQSHTGLS